MDSVDPFALTPQMLIDAIWKPYLDSATPHPVDDIAQAAFAKQQSPMPDQQLSDPERIDILVASVSHGAGSTSALLGTVLGIVSALRNVPGVREEIATSLERTKASQLAECLNPMLEEQFDQTAALVHGALAGNLAGSPTLGH